MNSEFSYLLNEIYPCLQGEGINLGKPSVLVRLQICNLRCSWCDTPYTHTFKSDPVNSLSGNDEQKFRRLTIDNLLSEVSKFRKISHIIVSGGEPTLQNLSPIFDALSPSHTIEVESNGTQIPHKIHRSFTIEHYNLSQWNISPKGKNAGQTINAEALAHWALMSQTHPKVYFKFVLRKNYASDDVLEVKSLLSTFNIRNDRTILMAEGTSTESQISNQWLEELCIENGWILSPRLHVLTHGAQRGV